MKSVSNSLQFLIIPYLLFENVDGYATLFCCLVSSVKLIALYDFSTGVTGFHSTNGKYLGSVETAALISGQFTLFLIALSVLFFAGGVLCRVYVNLNLTYLMCFISSSYEAWIEILYQQDDLNIDSPKCYYVH